jgi:hypothetical protein
MQTALILEYQKSVDLHTRSHLLRSWRATGSFVQDLIETTGSAPTMCAGAEVIAN